MAKIASNLEIAQKHVQEFMRKDTIKKQKITKNVMMQTNLTAVQNMNLAAQQLGLVNDQVQATANSLGKSISQLAETIEQRDQELSHQWK